MKRIPSLRSDEQHSISSDSQYLHSVGRFCGKRTHTENILQAKNKIIEELNQKWINIPTVFNQNIKAEKPLVVSMQANEQHMEFDIDTSSAVLSIRRDTQSQVPKLHHHELQL